jgi:hypothetical protein
VYLSIGSLDTVALALTLGPRSLAARRRSQSDEISDVCRSGSTVMDIMSSSDWWSRASRSALLKIGVVSSSWCGVGEVIFAWRFSFRKEGVVIWDRGSCGLKVGVEGGSTVTGTSFSSIFPLLFSVGDICFRGLGDWLYVIRLAVCHFAVWLVC